LTKMQKLAWQHFLRMQQAPFPPYTPFSNDQQPHCCDIVFRGR
jgi:hypothetical protein